MARGLIDGMLGGGICLPYQSAGQMDVIALVQSDPDGRDQTAGVTIPGPMRRPRY
jgi:hypothetical protein